MVTCGELVLSVKVNGHSFAVARNVKCSLKLEDQQFGQWIRAAQFNNSRKSVVEVAGFGEDAFIPSREASLLNNPRKFNQTLTGSVHWLVTGISLEKEKVSNFERKIREIDKELIEDGGGSNLNIWKSDTINLEEPLEVNCDANSEIVGDKEVVDKMDKLRAIHVSNPMNCGAMENLGKILWLC
nr:hypothetical protein CFP56_29779 [Quercus suber]